MNGQTLKQLRIDKGLTQDELGDLAGISRQAVLGIENGIVKNPKYETVKALANALGVDTSVFDADVQSA